LRHLSAEGLIRTARGAGGGSYVAQPSLDRMASFMSTNISLLERSTELSLAEFLEARELLEIPAARLAAERRTEAELERLRATLPDAPHNLTTGEQFVHNRDFHSTIVDTCANSLLSLAAAPIFIVLQTRLARRRLDDAFHTAINLHHREIAAAIEAADGAAAGEAMAEHLAWLRPAYERAWRDGPIV
jgi:DNA-binding FadR family transcriptional regulator